MGDAVQGQVPPLHLARNKEVREFDKSDCCNLRDMTAEADHCCKLVNDRSSRDPFTPEVLLAEQITVFTYVPTALTGLGFTQSACRHTSQRSPPGDEVDRP